MVGLGGCWHFLHSSCSYDYSSICLGLREVWGRFQNNYPILYGIKPAVLAVIFFARLEAWGELPRQKSGGSGDGLFRDTCLSSQHEARSLRSSLVAVIGMFRLRGRAEELASVLEITAGGSVPP